MQVWSLGQEDPQEEQMATYSGILVWKIPWTEETGRLKSMGWQRVGYKLAHTHTHTHTHSHTRTHTQLVNEGTNSDSKNQTIFSYLMLL